jgi:dethiobiotin synthetase
MSKIFVTASGTEVGKTFVTRALISQLRKTGRSVHALKPIATGFKSRDDKLSDTKLLLHALELDTDAQGIDNITPWRFREALSPDMAAAREQTYIPFDKLIAFCEQENYSDVTLIEGIGGVMVPLNETHTVLDWIIALRAPVLLIVGSYLGTLSHTLTALGMLRTNSVTVTGIVVNQSPDQPVTAQETANVISRFNKDIPIQTLPRVNKPEDAPNLLSLINDYL